MIILEDILSQEIIQKLGWTLVHFIWQAAVAASLLAILLKVLRKSTANLRYILACLALALIVLLPVITIQLIPVSVPHMATYIEPAPVPTVLPMEEMPAAETIVLEEPVQSESIAFVLADSWKQRTIGVLEPALPYIVSGWLVGVFGLSLWHLGGWTQLQRLKRRMVKQVDYTLGSKLKVLAQRLRVKQTVQLMESALVQIPTVVGWLRPVILLPASALTGLSSEQLEAILAHELAHIKRFDYLINILQTVVEILGFYHPAVWWVSHKIRAERENCCDDLAVSISGDRVCYARALTSMEEIRTGQGQLAVAATGGNLFKRIYRLLGKDSAQKTSFSWVPAVTAILLIIALVIPTALALTNKSTPLQAEPKTDVPVEGEEESIRTGKVILKLIDPNSQPVVGAKVGTYVDWSDIAESPPIWFLNDGGAFKAAKVKSDEEGKVVLGVEVLFKYKWPAERRVALIAMDDGRSFAGLCEVSREDLGCEVTLTLQPTCRVHGRFSVSTVRERGWSTDILTVYMFWNTQKVFQYTSRQRQFEFLLPPGRYEVMIYAEDPKKAMRSPIVIKPGQRELDISEYLDDESKLSAAKTDVPVEGEEALEPVQIKELVEIEKRVESAKKLSNLGKALLIYANDHDDKYPDSLHHLPVYSSVEELKWVLANVKYLAHGKTVSVRPDTVIAYDKMLLAERKGTNVLFNDSHVEFVKPERLKELGIGATAILIDTRLLSVSEDFLKDIGLDANSVHTSDAWSEHLVAKSAVEPNDETYSLILDDLHISFLLKAVQAHEGAKMLAAPRVTVLEGKEARIAIQRAIHYISGYAEPNRPSDEPEPKKDKVELGTRIWLKPELTPDNENIKLDFKLEIRQLLGFEERKYKGKYIYLVPRTDVVSTKMPCLIPDGKTMLIVGLKIIEQVESRSGAPLLSKLPVVGGLFKRSTITDIKDHKMLLILVKPIINPQQKASKILPGEADSEEHIKSLARQLEKKLNHPAEPK